MDKNNITIEALGNHMDSKRCRDRLSESRDWIDSKLQSVFDSSTADYATKKLIADVAANLVIYIQETSTANYNFTNTSNSDKINQ